MKVFFFLLILTINILPQEFSLMGIVKDSSNGSPLASANVILLHLPDSSVMGAAANLQGKFLFDDVEPGRYSLIISYVGYKKYSEMIRIRDKSIDLGTIMLIPGELTIEDIEIIGRLTPVIQNADTTQYNADAFKTHKDADAIDLVTKMPGITVTDGKVKAQGEDVKKVLVDGRQFFGEDPNTALKNLPAEIVDRIQVFDEQSEQAKFTGFDDGNTSKTMNVVTRMRIRQGTFGRLSAGYGDDKRYSATASISNFNDDQRFSVVGQLNNINEQNFSREDLMGIMSSGRRGGGGGGGFFMGGGGSVGFRGPASDFLVGTADGLTETKAFGINYSDKYWEKFTLSGSYFINRTDNSAESEIRRQYFLPEMADQRYYENSSSSSNNINHRLNMRIEYQIDSMNELSFRPRFSLQQNEGKNNAFAQTLADVNMLNSLTNFSSSDLSAINSSAELNFRHKFPAERRTLSVFLNGNYSNNGGDSRYYSENTYYINSAFSDTLNQFSDLFRDGKSILSNITYTEPIGENGMVQVNSEFMFKRDNNDQKRFNSLFETQTLDTSLSNLSDKIYNTQSYGTGYRYQDKELSFNVNLNYNISKLKNDQQYPYAAIVERTFYSVLPSAMMRYRISRDQDMHFFYRTNNNDPNIELLQDVLDNSNPLQLRIGNPGLKQDYRHSFSLRYNSMSMQTLNSIFIMLNASLTNNYIGNNTLITGRDSLSYRGILLNPGTQLTTPVNLNGYFNIGTSVFYSMPVEFIKSYLNLNLDASFSRIPGMINNKKGFSNSGLYTFGTSVTSNISTNFDFTLSGSSTYNNVKNNLRNNNVDYLIHNASLRLRSQFWEGFIIDNNMNYKYDSSLPENYNRNIFIWNISLGKKLFSKDQGEIRISAYDILNKGTNIRRYTGDSYYQDTIANTIGRYFILSFIYQIRSFGS